MISVHGQSSAPPPPLRRYSRAGSGELAARITAHARTRHSVPSAAHRQQQDPRGLATLNDKFIGAAVDAGVSIEMRRLSGGHNKTYQTGKVRETILGEQIRFLSDVLDLVPASPSLPTAPDGGRPQVVSRREPPSREAGRRM
jgi:hypothetical protein